MSTTEMAQGVDSDSGESIDQPRTPEEMQELLSKIGVARFASRISAGLIEELAGYEAIERFVKTDAHRPLLSQLGQALLRRPNSYEND